MWHVSSRRGVATLRAAILYTCYLLVTYWPLTYSAVEFIVKPLDTLTCGILGH